MKIPGYDRDTLYHVHSEITKLETSNWNRFHNRTEYAKGLNKGYRDCARILTSILNENPESDHS